MSTVKYVKPEPFSLREHPDLTEKWVQRIIEEDPSCLGLGDVSLLKSERPQEHAGRLDLMLVDYDENRRYEVELMLGACDPSHIVRTVEYWDIERRRYPAYDHVAVIVAEDITTRFLNVLSLFSGSIPLIAIQMKALKVGDHVTLHFARVLDMRALRVDDDPGLSPPASRQYWQERAAAEILAVVDTMLELVNAAATKAKFQLNYARGYIGLNDGLRTSNFLLFVPRKKSLAVYARTEEPAKWVEKLESAGLDASPGANRLRIGLNGKALEANRELIAEIVRAIVAEFET